MKWEWHEMLIKIDASKNKNDFRNQAHAREIIKIGHEINKMKRGKINLQQIHKEMNNEVFKILNRDRDKQRIADLKKLDPEIGRFVRELDKDGK